MKIYNLIKNKRNQQRKKAGFTLIEMMIVAPIVIFVIGVFVTTIVAMTGQVLTSKGSNYLILSINDALDKINQDVKTSNSFLATNSFTPAAGQGYNGDNSNQTDQTLFDNADAAKGDMLILNSYVTTKNPLDSTRNFVYAVNQPYACNNTLVSQNSIVMANIVYFVKTVNGTSSLWRRVLLPSGYSSITCSTPWQLPSCTPGNGAPFCKTSDMELVDGVSVSGFDLSYYSISDPINPIVLASDPAQSDSVRQTALQTASSIQVTIAATKTLAGRDISQSGTIRAVSSNLDATARAYKRPITITNSSGGALTNYQVQINPFTDAAFLNNTGLVGSWHLNEDSGTTTADSSGNSNTGTMNGTSYWDSSGKFGSSFAGNGASGNTNYVSSSITNLPVGASIRTIEAWFKTTSTPKTYNTIFAYGSSAAGKVITVVALKADGKVYTETGSGNDPITSATVKNDGNWHHVTLTYDGTYLRMYVDGALEGSPVTTTLATVSSNFQIGNMPWDANYKFTGQIDEVKIYNRALSATEVSNHYGTSGVPKVRSDHADIRFKDSTGATDYPYWQETDGKYWVKIPSLATGTTDISMYYGNPSASNSSSGANTFLFFDDFRGTTIDTGKWTELDAKNAIQQNNGLNLTNVSTVWDSALISNATFTRTVGVAVSGSFRTGSSVAAPCHMMVGWETNQNSNPSYNQLVHGFYFNAGSLSPLYENGASYTASGTYAANSTNSFRVRLKSTGADYLNNGASVYSGVGGSFTTTPMRIAITQYNHTGTFNNIYVHQSAVTEPTHAAPGAETATTIRY